MKPFNQVPTSFLILFVTHWRLILQVNSVPIERYRELASEIYELPGVQDLTVVQYRSGDTDSAIDHQQSGILSRASTTWSYSDTGSWSSAYPTCGGQRQSPVNLVHATLKAYPKLELSNYGNIDRMTVTNNGHTVLFSVPSGFSTQYLPSISGGGFDNTYQFVQFHFHWGSDSSQGSEHQIKSRKYAAELHMVHYNTKYPSYAEATNHDDGLAVLGIFLKVGNQDNSAFQPIVDQLSEVVNDGDETTLQNIVSFQKLLPWRTSSFYRYSGSLTTPGCNEIVTWTVFDTPVTISENQISKFRNLKNADGGTLVNNYRPLQPLNDRVITYRSNVGCQISRNWPISPYPIADGLQYLSCVTGFFSSSVLSLFIG